MRRTELHEEIFAAYKSAGKVLTMGELRKAMGGMGTSREGWQKAIKKCQRVFRSRWNEIYDTKLGIVHTPKPEPVPAPVEHVEEAPAVDPLEALKAAREQREEHE
jgi:hypothetical protein